VSADNICNVLKCTYRYYRKTSIKRRVPNKRRVSNKRRGLEARV